MNSGRYYPLKNIRGMQSSTNLYQINFIWEKSAVDSVGRVLWILMEGQKTPMMFNYSQCYEQRISALFQYMPIPTTEIRMLKFLVFVTEGSAMPSQYEIAEMSRIPEFLCEVCCGVGNVEYAWKEGKKGLQLTIESDKIIPEGLLFYEYRFENGLFQIDVPGKINVGQNLYEGMIFPKQDMYQQALLKSRIGNISIRVKVKKTWWSR